MQRGFTLIEMLIVIAIIAIVGSMALPAFNQMLENNRRVAAANDFLTSIHIARSEAITRNQRVSLCPANQAFTNCVSGGSWNAGWLVFRHAGAATGPADEDAILMVGSALPGGLKLVPNGDQYQNLITFLPRGRAQAAGTMLLCDAGAASPSRAIVIDMVGRARVDHEPGGSCP